MTIWEVSQEAMEVQGKTLRRINQEAPGNQAWGNYPDWPYDICPTRDYP